MSSSTDGSSGSDRMFSNSARLAFEARSDSLVFAANIVYLAFGTHSVNSVIVSRWVYLRS
eukprot:9468998-Pyramimonas_sp.AAC.1